MILAYTDTVLSGDRECLTDWQVEVHRRPGVGEHLPRLKRGEPWYEISVDDPDRRRRRYPEPVGR